MRFLAAGAVFCALAAPASASTGWSQLGFVWPAQGYGYVGYGNVVIVRVAPTIITIYAHLASWSVKPGDKVLPSEPIAVAGCTGICTGTHLHFEVRVTGVPVNPLQFLSPP